MRRGVKMTVFGQQTNQMTANVLVKGVGEQDVRGSIVVKRKDSGNLNGSLDYKNVNHHEEINGFLTVKQKGMQDLFGSFGVRPNNRMVGCVNVVEPPVKAFQSVPIKDANLASNAPYLQFGLGSELAVGKISANEEYRSTLAFNLQAIDSADLENLKYAKLKLRLVRPVNKATTLTLYTTSKSDWSETGVNWVNQSPLSKMIATANIPLGASYIEFNLFNFFKQNATTSQILSFTIRDVSNTTLTIPITFGSRETDEAPLLDYAYQYFPPSAGVLDMRGSLTPRFQNTAILAGSLHITNGLFRDDLQGFILINKKQNTKEIVGNLTVCKKNMNEFVGSLIITKKTVRTELAGSIVSKQITESYINGSITMVNIQNQNDFPGYIVVKQEDGSAINGSMLITSKLEDTNFPGSIVIKQQDNTAINGSLLITSKFKDVKLPGSIVVRQGDERNLDGSILITQNAKYSDIVGSIISKQKNETSLNGLFTLVGIEKSNELMGSIKVRATDFVDLQGSLVLNSKEKELNFGGSIVVKQLDKATLDGSLAVPRVDKEADIQGHIIIRQHDSKNINGSLIVKRHAYDDLIGTLLSRPKWGEDIEGSVVVTYGSSYAFIM